MDAVVHVVEIQGQVSEWAAHNLPLLLLIGLVALVGIAARRLRLERPDRAERVFLRAGLKAQPAHAQRLRDEFAAMAMDAERRRAAEDTRQENELIALQREKERIIHLVRDTPAVVKEVGRALREIEDAYEQGLRAVKSEQAREGLRLTTEKQISEVLASVSGKSAELPRFQLGGDAKPDIAD